MIIFSDTNFADKISALLPSFNLAQFTDLMGLKTVSFPAVAVNSVGVRQNEAAGAVFYEAAVAVLIKLDSNLNLIGLIPLFQNCGLGIQRLKTKWMKRFNTIRWVKMALHRKRLNLKAEPSRRKIDIETKKIDIETSPALILTRIK